MYMVGSATKANGIKMMESRIIPCGPPDEGECKICPENASQYRLVDPSILTLIWLTNTFLDLQSFM